MASLPFKTDYAKSGRSKCHTLKSPITAGTLRVATMVKSRNFDGMQPQWNDAQAFLRASTRRKRPQTTDEIEGFDDLRPRDQERIEGWMGAYRKINTTNSDSEKQAVRAQASLVWKIRDLTTGQGNTKALPPATIKAILTENQIPVKGNPDLIKTLAELLVFGVPPVGNSSEGCCASQPLRFCAHNCRYVCQAAQAWGECTYSQSVDETDCSKIQLPPKFKAQEWLEAVKELCTLEPQERLYVEKTTTVTKMTPATTSKKRTASSAAAQKGKHKPQFSRACMDPSCGLPESAFHVLDDGHANAPKEAFPTDLYDTTLCMTDLSSGTNSQYQLQLLVPDSNSHNSATAAYLWRKWGRVGGKGGGGTKLDPFDSVHKAKTEFAKLFQKQTGNPWRNRKLFVKHPGKFSQLDVSYVHDNDNHDNGKAAVTVKANDPNSQLDPRVQQVVAAFFDEGIAMTQLKSLKVDLTKMPLGKMTEAQLKDAYSVLAEIEDLLDPPVDATKNGKLQQLSNQFYSKCPSLDPRLIDSMKLLKEKVEMVDELLNLQASNAVANKNVSATMTSCPVDEAYGRLQTDFTPLDPHGEQYKMLQKYVDNTRNASLSGAATGNDFASRGLRLLDAFEVKRDGEASRFLPSKALGNRRLLWHGSRIGNYTGILRQGLRIAPPEAPVSGYRFGKGVYFADMLGKSANYCRTNGSSEMFIMACDVSLGTTFETSRDLYMEKPQPGTHSTHALSEVVPDPSMSLEMTDKDSVIRPATTDKDKVLIPLGTPMSSKMPSNNRPSCDVSEFIVYNQAQVNIRFLLRLTTDPSTKATDGSVGSVAASQVGTGGGFIYVGGQRMNLLSAPQPSSVTNWAHSVAARAAQAMPNNSSGDDDSGSDSDNDVSPPKKKAKVSASCFIKLDKEDRSRPSLSGLKVLNSRTFVEGLRLTVVRGEITESKTDAIVVPSDANLSLSGMVGEKVKGKGGTAFVQELNAYLSGGTAQQPASASLVPSNIRRLDSTTTGKTIRELATAANIPYLTPFYKVVKKEDISVAKDIICMEASSGTYRRGQAARSFLKLASNTKVSLKPADIPAGVEVFVQSSSHNRKMPRNSSVLLETSMIQVPVPATATTRNTLQTSEACVVGGHGLSASHVVFVVSPIYNNMQQSSSNAETALKETVKNALVKCSELGLKTVTLPSIGSGRAGYDKGKAATWIIEAIAVYLEDVGISASKKKQSIEEVCFCLFDDESLEAYRRGILAYENMGSS